MGNYIDWEVKYAKTFFPIAKMRVKSYIGDEEFDVFGSSEMVNSLADYLHSVDTEPSYSAEEQERMQRDFEDTAARHFRLPPYNTAEELPFRGFIKPHSIDAKPEDDFGISPIESVMPDINLCTYLARWNKEWFDNRR